MPDVEAQLDFLFISATCLGFLLAYNALGLKPFRRGFFCDDQSISYPYYSDTVSDELATLICIITPGLFVSYRVFCVLGDRSSAPFPMEFRWLFPHFF